MCGIVGIAGNFDRSTEGFALQCNTLRHRGPDASGEWFAGDGNVALGHRRLSIIDLSDAASQPMADQQDKVQLILNGEIYNYREIRKALEGLGRRFRSASDTEVLLQAYLEWDVDCLRRLNGMFAFAVYDSVKRRLFLARDRAGEKPLFYTHSAGRLSFASELKALMAGAQSAPAMNVEALDHFLAYGHVPGGLCLVEGVRKLPPAHALTYDIDSDSTNVWKYWDLPHLIPPSDLPDEQLVDEADKLLCDAVRLQLVADVPVGILLSGGVDSSLITAAAARVASGPVRTFTIAFPGQGVYNEGPYASIVAAHFGTRHTELVAEPASVELLPQLARQYDEPIGDSSMVPTFLVSKLVRETCTVALGGDGGDELFGGYIHYSRLQAQMKWRTRLPRMFKSAVAAGASIIPTGVRGKSYLRSLRMPDEDAWIYATLHFDGSTRRKLSPATRSLRGYPPEEYHLLAGQNRSTLLQKISAVDFETYLPEDILVKVDRASMLASLEVRAPFLDYRIIEFAFGRVRDPLRATATEQKVLLKMLARRVLPAKLDIERKQGFSLPLDSWFKGSWGKYLSDVLRSAPRSLFDPHQIDTLLSGQQQGLPNAQRLFNLAILELWRREYNVQVGPV